MGLSAPKQFFELQGVPVLIHTLRVFQQVEAIGVVIVVVPSEHCVWVEELVQRYQLTKVYRVTAGGKERQDSVLQGLIHCADNADVILVHDGARPFPPRESVQKAIISARKD